MLVLDHIAIAAETLEAGQEWVEERLGVQTQPGGQHPVMGTHNRLMGLEGGEYLEIIAIDPSLPTPDRARWFGLDQFSGTPCMGNWICRCASLDEVLAGLPRSVGRPVALSRGDLSWRMAVPDRGMLPFDQAFPAIMEWQSGGHPSDRLASSGYRLTRLMVDHPDAEALSDLLKPLLPDPRLTISKGVPRLRAELATQNGKSVIL